ncbi:hypothetical protein SAMN04488097_3247 [Epilithonimonas lactis]|uniref:Uncharacterized protein n=1 Tax=Epilithonimonas lactis TaxID=421072 RepID=A0A085BJT2_9FLAO|nr:hypothetical protein IO89_06650 [Epilithonimonas lactis]SEQ85623.1 hypothetical protein SAMN04488097_3247 [Epilithonimonas lactis]
MVQKFKIASLLSYFFIFIMGSMIAMPFGCILLLSFLDFSVLKYTIFGIVGIIILFYNLNRKTTNIKIIIDVLVFLLLLYPIMNRLFLFSMSFLNHPTFYIPLGLFISFYLISIFFEFKNLRTININS